jgi:hypothetical protein
MCSFWSAGLSGGASSWCGCCTGGCCWLLGCVCDLPPGLCAFWSAGLAGGAGSWCGCCTGGCCCLLACVGELAVGVAAVQGAAGSCLLAWCERWVSLYMRACFAWLCLHYRMQPHLACIPACHTYTSSAAQAEQAAAVASVPVMVLTRCCARAVGVCTVWVWSTPSATRRANLAC